MYQWFTTLFEIDILYNTRNLVIPPGSPMSAWGYPRASLIYPNASSHLVVIHFQS